MKPESCGSDKPDFKKDIRWLEIAAGIASLIAICGLVALLSQNAGAAGGTTPTPPRGGFSAGPKTFSNPFANTAQPKAPAGADRNNFFDDDSDDSDDSGDSAAPGERVFNVPQAGTMTTPGAPVQGISGGGTPPGGLISHNEIPSIKVDSETGEGSKDIVTDFNFPDADIMDIAKTLGRLTGKNFILDKDVKGRITIIANSPITVGDAWRAFLTALDINSFAIIPSGKFLRIARQRDARDKQLKTYTGDYSPDTDALITRVFPLKYINAEEVARTFRSFMPANSRIIGYDQTNTVIVTDTGSNIAKLAKMLEILDIEGYDAGIEVIPVKYASASELAKLIDQLLPGTGNSPTASAPRFGAPSASRFAARRTKEGGIINTIIADERTNTLIVHANTKGADQIRELVAKLDQNRPSAQGGGKVHVVYLQYADAEQVATTLNNLSSGSSSAFHPVTPGGAGTGTGTNPVAASLFEGAIKVSPDKSTNALVVTASPADFVVVERVIARLDIPRDEVFIEVVIMEVDLGSGFNYSANLINPASGIALTPNTDLYSYLANPAALSGAILGFRTGGQFSYTPPGGQPITVSNLQGMLNLLQTNTKSNILATPQIIALDNTEAFFESSEKIPEPTTTSVQGAGVSQGFTNITVPLSIKLTPQINKVSNFVRLKIEAKLSTTLPASNVPPAIASQAFATLDRTATTTAVVADGDTVVLGGLVRDSITDQVNKIPVLGDIPLLGWFFKSKNTQITKTNLLIFLTPHIVRQYDTIRAILDRKLKERDEFITKNAGGSDPLRDVRDDMIRSLPDLKKELSEKPQSSISIDEGEKGTSHEQLTPFTGSEGSGSTPPPAPEEKPGATAVPEPGAAAPGVEPGVPPPAPEAPIPPPQPQSRLEKTTGLTRS